MKKLLLSSVVIVVLAYAGAVSAADQSVPVYRASAAGSWTGFYVGGNLGLSVGRNPTSAPILVPSFGAERFILSPLGPVGGVQAGYNWQVAPRWVLGIEADIQGSGQLDSGNNCVVLCLDRPAPSISESSKFTQRLPWFGTVRGRVGSTNGPALFYATGGWVYGRVETHLDFIFTNAAVLSTATGRFAQYKSGWTVGGGIEAQLVGNWTGKVEYLYLDLGSVSGTTPITGTAFTGAAVYSSSVRDHIVRLGVNYKFGDPIHVPASSGGGIYKAQPVVAVFNWSGFYIGGNFGVSVGRNPTNYRETFGGALSVDERVLVSPVGLLGGGQIGINWQVAPSVVLGVEADFQATSQRDSHACLTGCNTTPFFIAPISQKLPWFGTARGRAGWTNGPTLLYATGGFAYGNISMDFNRFTSASSVVGTVSANTIGWTAGGGLETQIVGNWTGKIEYLYLELGDVSGSALSNVPGGTRVDVSARVRDHIARVGINYKLN